MINKKYHYAVIWASNKQEKYWYKVFSDLKHAGYQVYPINPYEKNRILGQKVYANLVDCYQETWDIDVAIFVVSPNVTLNILQKIKTIKIGTIRFQPWSESEEVISFCKKNHINYTANACIMIEKNNK